MVVPPPFRLRTLIVRRPKILSAIKDYRTALLLHDLWAGLTVAMVALPLSLAIAIASGADPGAGLITAIVAGFFVSAFGGSRVQIGGPTGAFIVVVFDIIQTHGYDGLVTATLMAGLILFVAGQARLGRLIAYVPEAVINGFTIGIAIVIATSQIPDFFGLGQLNLPGEFTERVPTLLAALPATNLMAMGIALLTLVLIIVLRRAAPKWPGLIVAVGAGSLLVGLMGLEVDTIGSRFGALPNALPLPHLPKLEFAHLIDLLPAALLIAFLAGVESLLSALVADRLIDDHHAPNAELSAQGIANFASALFGGLPATGAIARTMTNIKAGGQTPLAGIFHAVFILIAMLFASRFADELAMPALAALLMLTAWNMSEPHRWAGLIRGPKLDLFLVVLTLVLTVMVDLAVAIGVGSLLGLAFKLAKAAPNNSDWTPPNR